jgi:CRP-like cAMP-binding protein
MALISGGERMATVVATAPTSLLVLSRADFTSLLAAVPAVAPKLMQVMGQRIRELATASGNALPF